MATTGGWSPEEIDQALAALKQRHPLLSAGMFRILMKTAMQEVEPPDLPALIDRADKIIAALKDSG